MLPIAAWRIFYADGSSFSSAQGSWADAPPFGVQVVVYYHTEGQVLRRTLQRGREVYVLEGKDELAGIKMGLWLDAEGHYRIVDLAKQSSLPEPDEGP